MVAQDQGVLLSGNSLPPDQGHAAVPMCLRHDEEALVLVYGSRRPIKRGAEARRMDASLRGGEANLERVWPGLGVPLHYSGDSAMSPLVLSSSSNSTGVGCYGTDMAEASSVQPFPRSLCSREFLARVRREDVSLLLVALFWPGRVWFSDLISLHNDSPWEIPVRRDHLSQAGVFHPCPELRKL